MLATPPGSAHPRRRRRQKSQGANGGDGVAVGRRRRRGGQQGVGGGGVHLVRRIDDYRPPAAIRGGERPEAATALISVGESPRDTSLEPAEHAAWTLAAALMLNLSETVTRG